MDAYRRAASILALLLIVVIQGCSSSGVSGVPPVATGHLAETPLAASAFVDSVGVNLHMTYGSTPYDTDFQKWAPVLIASGIKHVRDATCPTKWAYCRAVVPERFNRLAASGIRFDLLTSLSDSANYANSYVQTMDLASSVEAIEGANECDSGLYCTSNWKSTEGGRQKTLFATRSPGITVIGPSMVSQSGYSALGDLSAFMDVGNVHDYVGAEPPETQSGIAAHLDWAHAMSKTKPVWATEMGYGTDPRSGKNGIPRVVQERYIPRMLLEHLRRGVMRTYVYQLFDYGPDDGAYMGLLNADYTPKPAWTRLRQLIAFFKDDAASPVTPLSYNIQDDAAGTMDHLLFQRSDGTYLLALWMTNAAYDTKTHAVLKPSSEVVRITLPPGVSSSTLTEFLDNGTTQSLSLTPSGRDFSVPVSNLVSILAFKPE